MRFERTGEDRTMTWRRSVLMIVSLAALAACEQDPLFTESNGRPRQLDQAPAIDVAFSDSSFHLSTVHTAGEPTPTGVEQPGFTFASTDRGVVMLSGRLFVRYQLNGESDILPVNPPGYQITAGAVSPDGTRMAYGALGKQGGDVFLYLANLVTGDRDSVDMSTLQSQPAAPQLIESTPVFSPSGDSVAFLLPNFIGVQVLIYEVNSKRVEVFAVPVATSTSVQLLPGWPRWTQDGEDSQLRFLAQRKLEDGTLTDTLMVMAVYPRNHLRPAERLYQAYSPDTLPLEDVRIYSFDRTGDVASFFLTSGTHKGVWAIASQTPKLQRIFEQTGTTRINQPLLIP
jgi:hypothetical protein